MQLGIALTAEPDLHRNNNLTVLHPLAHPLDEPLCRTCLAAQQSHSLRHPAEIARGQAEPAPG